MKKYSIAFYDYKERICRQSPLMAFWVSNLDMVTVLLTAIFIWSLFKAGYHGYLPMTVTSILTI